MKPLANLSAYRGRTLALYGGTMDPIHCGHVEVARQAMAEMGWEELILMVAGTPPHKKDRKITEGAHRLMMARLAVEEIPGITVCDWEIARQEYSYTADTLVLLRQEFGMKDIDFLIGADSLMMLERWYKPEVILKNCRIVAAGRPEQVQREIIEQQAQYLREKYGARIVLLTVDGPDISASDLRERLLLGQNPGEALPQKVRDYICRERLYGGEA